MRRRLHMSLTESLFIYMILPVNFMRSGRGGGICPIYASLSIMMQRSRRRDWHWSRALSRSWHRVWLFSASMLRMRCDRLVGAKALAWGYARASGGSRFVCSSELAAFPKGAHHHDG